MVAMVDETIESTDMIIVSFKGMADFFEWNVFSIIARVTYRDANSLNKTNCPEQAYKFEKNL